MFRTDTDRVLDLLLSNAGITASVAGCENVSTSGLTNRTAVVTLADGSRYVLRQYSWPHESPDDLDRLRKEIYLHELLWVCSGWLDWEFAWVGDPTWDLVRMDLIRTRPIGPSPQAFYDGYGKEPGEPYRSIYELSILLWMANQYLDGDRFLMPTYEAAMRYVEELRSEVDRIDSLITEAA